MSVAQYAAFNRYGSERFRLQSYRNYSRTIKMLQEAMQVEGSVTDDKIVTTILLLCMLKDISGEGSGDPQEHAPGLFYLLEQRGPDQIISKTGAQLFLLAHLRLRPSQTAFPTFPKSQTLDNIKSTIRMCFEALEDFARWDAEAAAYWEQSFVGRTVPTMLGQVALGMTSYDADTACIIILIRSPRLILLLTMLLYYGKTQTGPVASRSKQEDNAAWEVCVSFLEDDVRKTIDDIIHSVPSALGWEGGGTAKIFNWIAEQEFLRSMIFARSKDLQPRSEMPVAPPYYDIGQVEVDWGLGGTVRNSE
ncbi:hypothetical protein ACHAQH_008793 [Verticillium albo-atrum]